jgi:hypothetical protein
MTLFKSLDILLYSAHRLTIQSKLVKGGWLTIHQISTYSIQPSVIILLMTITIMKKKGFEFEVFCYLIKSYR